MNFRNKYLLGTLRIVFGLFMVFSGVMGFISGSSTEKVPAEMIPSFVQLYDSGIWQMIKLTEIIAGLMLVFGFLPALAAILIAPVCVGLIVYGVFIVPALIPMAVVLALINVYFGYVYWDKYKALFVR